MSGTSPDDIKRAFVRRMQGFWQQQLQKVEELDFEKTKSAPAPARIRQVMQADENLVSISPESTLLFSKAAELFVLDLTMRAWAKMDKARRSQLKMVDMGLAMTESELYDFLAVSLYHPYLDLLPDFCVTM